ncbi:hypothetical protein ACIQK6_26730 [Streptomyces sp. NPDC091682]
MTTTAKGPVAGVTVRAAGYARAAARILALAACAAAACAARLIETFTE